MDPFSTIESLSEYFVANSKTSLTDFIDSANNSGSSTNNIMNSPIFDSLDNSSDGSLNNHKQTNSTASNLLQQPHHNTLDQQLPSNGDDLDPFDLGCDDDLGGPTSNNHSEQQHHQQQTSNNHRISNNNTQHHADYIHNPSSSSTSSAAVAAAAAAAARAAVAASSKLLSQPIRTQVPIYCQIEQFDTCPSVVQTDYQPTLNDNDLFKTTDYKDSFKQPMVSNATSANQSNTSGSSSSQPHLHQSKLALESVTNCLLSPSSFSGPTCSAPSLNNSSDIDIKPRVKDDFDGLDFDQLEPNSPLSLHHEPSPLKTSLPPSSVAPLLHQRIQFNNTPKSKNNEDLQQISILNNSLGNQDSFNPSLSSCKETYVLVQASTPWLDLVRTVLTQLGYSGLEIVNSKG